MSRSAAVEKRNYPHVVRALEYARAVLDGEILACKWVKLACQRFISDLVRAEGDDFPYFLDREEAERVCKFIERFPHVKGKWAVPRLGDPDSILLRLEPWQCFLIVNLYGWLQKAKSDRDRHLRRFRMAYIAVPRKNAKSTVVAPLGNFHLAADGEIGAEVFCGATSKDQAMEVFRPARQMAAAPSSAGFRRVFGVEVASESLFVPETGSFFKPLVGKPGDGASPSASIIDEYHEHKDDALLDAMRTGMGAREQPMCIVITTAGTDISSPCYALQQDIEKILEGVFSDEETFGIIYTIDEGVDWSSEEALIMANPNYGISVDVSQLRALQREALRSPRKQGIFKIKRLNVWTNARDPWMNLAAWQAVADPSLTPEAFRGCPGWFAIDLSNKTDIASTARIFWRDGDLEECSRCKGKKHIRDERRAILVACARCQGTGQTRARHFYAFGRHYLPEAQIEAPENQHYQGWHKEGKLIAIPGNVIDPSIMRDDLLEDARAMETVGVAYDPWNATGTALELQDEGLSVVEVPQTVRNLSFPMKEVEALVLAGRFHHNGDPVLTWAVSNVVAKEDARGNLFPRKVGKKAKIDPAVAMLTAMSRALVDQGVKKTSIYEERGARSY